MQKANLAGREEAAREQQELLRKAMLKEERNKLLIQQQELQQKQEHAQKEVKAGQKPSNDEGIKNNCKCSCYSKNMVCVGLTM